ncbi:hypothetical protein K3495_g4042 [Podosphaera aphanis]|nr:hypothetical protein K3495_g4042 [Podosphaera aphanis]
MGMLQKKSIWFSCLHIHRIFFSPSIYRLLSLKARYRRLTGCFCTIYDSAPIKEQRFIKCYNEALNEQLAAIQIKGSWRAAGLFPFNCQRGLKNPLTQPPPQPRPTTPERQINKRQIDDILTPHKPADVHSKIEVLRGINELMRGTALFMRKAAKSVGQLQAQIA